MGNFGHHLAGSVAAGGVCGAAAYYGLHTGLADAGACGLICGISGLIPDIDSPVSRPSDIIANLAGALVPMFALQAIDSAGYSPSELLIIAFITYLIARFGLRAMIGRFTVHRGMIHSIPAAVIWGAVVFLAFRRAPGLTQNIMATAATIGFATHLMIDEMFSLVDISGGKFTPKASSGTALKFFGHAVFPNILTYAILSVLLYICAVDAGFVGNKYIIAWPE
ncbi:hypothetical protein MASR2M18_07010 [Ignavibacteria bacterium]|nr:metal-dependent hydrolase [Bacteroidota bacterium]